MSDGPSTQDTQSKLRALFNIMSEPSSLEELRVPAGTFDMLRAEALINAGLVEFDSSTGIAFQRPSEWDLILTNEGRSCLLRGDF